MQPILRILHLEDDERDAEIVRLTLEESGISCAIVRVADETAYTDLLIPGAYDCILADYTLPGFDGLAALALARKRLPDIPFVFVSGTIGDARAVETFRRGATDYVLKDRLAALAPSVLRAVKEAEALRERRKAEESLRQANAYNRSLIEASLDPLVTINAGGMITDVNAATERITGLSRGELIGADFSDCFTDPERARAGYQQAFQDGVVRDFALEIRCRDGRTTPVLYNATVYRDGTGAVAGVFAAARDISAQLKLEAQLRQSQKLEAIGQLAGGVAHDFNNILSAVVGYANLALMTMRDDDPAHEHLEEILTAAERAAVLTRSLLAFGRKQMIELQVHDLDEIVSHFKLFLRRLLREDIEIEYVHDGESLTVEADRTQIEQVLMNLATNARDAMPAGGRLGIILGRAVMDEGFIAANGFGTMGEYACVAVSDTGAGMEEDVRRRIFEPFFTTKGPGKGTGLGLSMVYGIVKRHNGYITVSSAPGQGTAFRVYLPLVSSARRPAERPARSVSSLAGGNETILVAEDDAALRKLSTAVLTRFGYRVIEAADGSDAVARFVENQDAVRLVILDGIMPRMNGMEAFEAIRRIRPDVKAVFASGYSEEMFSGDARKNTDAVFLLKPIRPAQLLKTVREVLDREAGKTRCVTN